MISAKLLVEFVAVISRVLVPLPVIDAEAARVETQRLDGLQEGTVGIAGMDTEFHDRARLQRADQPHCKWHVSQPGDWFHQTLGIAELQTAVLARQPRTVEL